MINQVYLEQATSQDIAATIQTGQIITKDHIHNIKTCHNMVLRQLQCLLQELPSKNNPFLNVPSILIACLHFMLSRSTVLTYFEGASETDP